MKTVTILADFSGYPNGQDEVVFRKGETPDLANDYADLLVGKGLAEHAKPKTPAKSDQKESAK